MWNNLLSKWKKPIWRGLTYHLNSDDDILQNFGDRDQWIQNLVERAEGEIAHGEVQGSYMVT